MQTLRMKGVVAQRKLEMLDLRRQAKEVFSPSNFAQSAKLERRANKIEKDMPKAGAADKRIALGGTAARGLQARSFPSSSRAAGTYLAWSKCRFMQHSCRPYPPMRSRTRTCASRKVA